MTEQHPITPPPEPVQQLAEGSGTWLEKIVNAYRAGANQELEACCEWVSQWCGRWPDGTRPEDELRTARRPKPPSLAERALEALEKEDDALPLRTLRSLEKRDRFELIRRALERLQELEKLSDDQG